MFKSIKYLRYDEKNKQYIYELVDSDFTCEVATGATPGAAPAAAAASEYEKRNLPVVPNIVLFYLSYLKRGYTMNDIVRWATEYKEHYKKCYPDYIEKGYYDEVGKQIEKLLLLEN